MFNLEKSSKFYWSNYLKDINIERTPEIFKPKNRIEAYGIQNNFLKYTSYNLFGWKVAATSSNGQKHIGVSEPLAGRIFKEKVYKNQSKVNLGNNKMAVAEPEFAFKINKDIFPRKQIYSINEVLSFIDDLYPVIELPNSRFTKYEIQGEEQLIADNACAHFFIIGRKFNGLWKNFDLENHSVKHFSFIYNTSNRHLIFIHCLCIKIAFHTNCSELLLFQYIIFIFEGYLL